MAPMQLHEDKNFHYEALRCIATTRYYGADIAEVLNILPKIRVGNVEDWYNEWHALALRVLSSIDEIKLDHYSRFTLRDTYFRASHYFFVADFFLHGNHNDPRLRQNYDLWRKYFDLGNAQLAIPGRHVTIDTKHGWIEPAMFFRAKTASESSPRPTLIIGGGFDSNMEELMHVFGFGALERDYNVVIYEGPGQPTLIHKEQKGFIHDWEKAVTPIVDYIFDNREELAYIDTKRIGLIGMSLGGYLCARAAAFEPRLCAVLACDGVFENIGAYLAPFPEDVKQAWYAGDAKSFQAGFDDPGMITNTNIKWFHDHIQFSFCSNDIYQIFQEIDKMTMKDCASQIKMPAFIGDASEDMFFLGQPQQLAKAIGSSAYVQPYTEEQAAGEHCQSGAHNYLNCTMYDWFQTIVGK